MTRINTNVSSLTAQKTLARSNDALQQALTRLSTGLRINSGKDDPAGLIASEALGSDIVSTQAAISNSQRANQVIATADSGLGQVSSLLNDIRALVTEAANTGAMSADQIAANQLQVDSSLEALNRIAQTTSFQGRHLLDGTLDFTVKGATSTSLDTVKDLQIQQANLGTSGSATVSVQISAAATQAELTNNASPDATANTTITFGSGAKLASAGDAVIDIYATDAAHAGKAIKLDNAGNGSGAVEADFGSTTAGTLTILVDNKDAASTGADVVAAINKVTGFHAVLVTGTNMSKADSKSLTENTASLKISANAAGPDFNGVTVSIATKSGQGAATPGVAYDSGANKLVVTIDDTGATDLGDIKDAINAYKADGTNQTFVADAPTVTGDARPTIDGPSALDTGATASTGWTGGGVLLDDAVLQVFGSKGSQFFNFKAHTSIAQIVSAINLQSDATGVAAARANGVLTLTSADYGSDARVGVNVVSEGTNGTFKSGFASLYAANGEDIKAVVNGANASGRGNTLSVNSAGLTMSATVSDGSSTSFTFDITKGGALFQLGPSVVTTQQARLGIGSVDTGSLGGATGKLYQIGSSGDNNLKDDPTKAAQIVDEAIKKVAALRGRLGAFQKSTVDTNINSLNDTLENLTNAKSAITDADFAAESAALTRAQILAQSGTAVLAIANKNPENVLALLR